jgi:hypothetical protein
VKFIQSLNESRMLSSTTAYRRFSARTICELTVLHICALRILYNDVRTHKWAHEYAQKSAKILQFARYYSSSTDLALLLYASLKPEEVEFRQDAESQDHMEGVEPDEHELNAWIRSMANNRQNESQTRRMFQHLDPTFNIENTSVRSIRRLVQDWPRLSNQEHKLAMTRLLQILRSKAQRSDLLAKLQDYADDVGLEITNADNQEAIAMPAPEKKKGSLLKKLTVGALGYAAARKFLEQDYEEELEEEASAGATAAASIAPCVAPLGAVRRRAN